MTFTQTTTSIPAGYILLARRLVWTRALRLEGEVVIIMSSGPWIPIPKTITSKLPKGRAYTWAEAYLSLAVDYDNGTLVTVVGYAGLWGWSRGKVERFLEAIGAHIVYPRNTQDVQKQRGKLEIKRAENEQKIDRNPDKNGQINLIDSRWLKDETSRNDTDSEQKASRRQGTTIYPKPKPNKRPFPAKEAPAGFTLFRNWWIFSFSLVEGDKYVFEGAKDGAALSAMLKAVDWKELVCKACHFLVDIKRFPPGPPTISRLKSSINNYPGHVNGKADHFRELGILPPDGILLEDWRPWENLGEQQADNGQKKAKNC